MVITSDHSQKRLQLSLYMGIGLIVVSMLFLGRQQAGTSFLSQAITVLAAPAFFYVIGTLVYRYLHAPLAAPGIIATGAWLVGVALIHLYVQRYLLPDWMQPYYWLGASLLAGVLITITGHWIRIGLVVPLVPLVQINAIWAIMGAFGVPVQWMPPLSFVLVLQWWELPRNERWISVYRGSAVLFTLFLLIFSVWLPISTPSSLTAVWGAGALVVTVLGLRHGWTRLGPLAIVMLVCASVWGLSATWWPLAWIILAAVTVIFIERVTTRMPEGKDAKAIELSEALAVLLCGAASFFAQTMPFWGMAAQPMMAIIVLLVAGILLVWLGSRRGLRSAIHAGLWLAASAWANLYFIAAPSSNTYGLWLAFFASCGLLFERTVVTARKEKRKSPHTLLETVMQWPLADLVIGLSTAALLWSALQIDIASPWTITATLLIVIGVWVTAGLVYRLPILLHLALWIAPIPYSLLLILAAPSIWSLPLLGVWWQILAIGYLIFGHCIPRYRPAVIAPFFVVGYALLGIGMIVAMGSEMLVPLTLGLVVIAAFATSAAVILGYHPAWDTFVEWLAPSEKRPYAFKHIHNIFLFLGAWLAVIWLQLMLGYTGMPIARQGVFLVLFAGLWFLLGWRLSRLPGVVGWPVIGAGWLLWLLGLLQVFFTPQEAVITMILGLIISGAVLYRTRLIYWIPVFILQVFFSVLLVARLMAMPGHIPLLLVAIGVAATGMMLERHAARAGRLVAVTGTALTLGMCLFQPNVASFVGLTALAFFAVLQYQRWQLLWGVYAGVVLVLLRSGIAWDWQRLFAAGAIQWVVGAELLRALHPRRNRSFQQVFGNGNWAIPFLWGGLACVSVALAFAARNNLMALDLLAAILIVVVVLGIYAARLRLRRMPYLALTAAGVGLLLLVLHTVKVPFSMIGDAISIIAVVSGASALAMRLAALMLLSNLLSLSAIRWSVWWIRPLLAGAHILANFSLILGMVGAAYPSNLLLRTGCIALVVVYVLTLYARTHELIFVWLALGLTFFGWYGLIMRAELTGFLWFSIPTGLVMLAAARKIRTSNRVWLEGVGTMILLIGGLLNIESINMTSPALWIFAVQIVGLAVYGYVAGRRIPFATSVVIVMIGLLFGLLKVNAWLIPLSGGLLLLSGTLFVEVQRDTVERWASTWINRWQQWR